MKVKKRILALLFILILAFSFSSTALAAPSYDPYTAIGDSISWGFQFGDDDYARSHQRSYPALVATQLGVTCQNDSVLAIDSSDLLKLLNCTPPAIPSSYFPNATLPIPSPFAPLPQEPGYLALREDLDSANLITIEIGSNDLTMRMVDTLFQCMYPFINGGATISDAELESFTPADHVIALRIVLDVIGGIIDYLDNLDPSTIPAALASLSPEQIQNLALALSSLDFSDCLQTAVWEFENNWDQIITKIRTMRPDATIVAVGYFNPFPMPIPLGQGMSIDLGFQFYIDEMNAYISGDQCCIFCCGHDCDVVDEYKYVDVSDFSQPGSPYLCAFPDPHPNEAGHMEIASRILSVLGYAPPAPVYTYYSPTFTIDATASVGGTITPSGVQTYVQGTEATYKFTADDGYILISVTIDGKLINTADSYTFKNITENHKMNALFVQNPFNDVGNSDWYFNAVLNMFANNLMQGTSDTTFRPNMTASRAMIAAIFYRMENKPDIAFKNVFSDVTANAWYSNAVIWASDNGLVAGYGNGKFGPNDTITREQLVQILFNYAKFKGYDTSTTTTLGGYIDSSHVSNWAKTAMEWALATGLMYGNSFNELDPDGAVVRAAITAIIYGFMLKF